MSTPKLRSTENALPPANRLPPETLSQIFSYVSVPKAVAAASGFVIPLPFRERAVVTHAYRYWREAATHAIVFISRLGAHPLKVATIPPRVRTRVLLYLGPSFPT